MMFDYFCVFFWFQPFYGLLLVFANRCVDFSKCLVMCVNYYCLLLILNYLCCYGVFFLSNVCWGFLIFAAILVFLVLRCVNDVCYFLRICVDLMLMFHDVYTLVVHLCFYITNFITNNKNNNNNNNNNKHQLTLTNKSTKIVKQSTNNTNKSTKYTKKTTTIIKQ